MSQTQIIISIAIVLIAVAIIVLSRSISTKSPYETVKKAYEIQLGPIRHSELSPALIERIHTLEETFAEVYPLTHEEWLDGFKRDQHPEKEIQIWEHMGLAYTQFLKSGDFDSGARKKAYGLLLVRSRTSDTESRLSDLKYLTEYQARTLFALYEGAPQPITIQKTERNTQPDP